MEFFKNKIVLIITIGVIPLIIIGILIFGYIGNRNTEKATDTAKTEKKQADTTRPATKVSDKAIVNATIDASNSIKYYSLDKGQTFQIPASGGDAKILDETSLAGITSVQWAPTAPYVLTQIKDRVYTFNYSTRKSFAFPIDVISGQFLSDNRVFYTFKNNAVGGDAAVELSVSNPDGTDWKKIITLTSSAVYLKGIPFQNSISQTLIPSSYRASALRIINISTGEAKSVLEEKNGLNVSWSPDGEKGIISYTTERGGSTLGLSVINKAGIEVAKIEKAGTIAEKIAWSPDSKTAYFTKAEVANTKILPDDYYSSNLGDFNESLYKIDIATATASQLSTNIGNVDSKDLFLNAAGTELFFTNRKDNNLYKVSLK
jgi:hypothetical protein